MRAMDTSYPISVLKGLQGLNIYQGTVPEEEVDRRRAANKRARRSRRINRMRARR